MLTVLENVLESEWTPCVILVVSALCLLIGDAFIWNKQEALEKRVEVLEARPYIEKAQFTVQPDEHRVSPEGFAFASNPVLIIKNVEETTNYVTSSEGGTKQ